MCISLLFFKKIFKSNMDSQDIIKKKKIEKKPHNQQKTTYQLVDASLFEILKFKSAIPPTGTLSLPVAK